MKPPYFPLFVNAWLGSARMTALTPAEEGAFLRLLLYEWNDTQCSLPDDDETLAVLSRLGPTWETSKLKLRALFVHDDGRLYNEKLLSLRIKTDKLREKQQAGGVKGMLSRWHKLDISNLLPTNNNTSTSTSTDTEKKSKRARKDSETHPSEPTSRIKLADEAWIESLKPDCRKQGINLDGEIIKAKRWLALNSSRTFTRRFFINWLNRADRNLITNDNQAPALEQRITQTQKALEEARQ